MTVAFYFVSHMRKKMEKIIDMFVNLHLDVRVSDAVIKHHGQKEVSWEEKGLFHLIPPLLGPLLKEFRVGTQGSKLEAGSLMQRPWRDVAYWLVLRGLLSLLS